MKKLIFLVFILISNQSSADTWIINLVSHAWQKRQFQKLIDRIISERVKPLTHSIMTFHYQPAQVTETHSDIVKNIEWQASRFFRPQEKTSDNVGPGYYVAIDPATSRGYGGNYWALRAITLKSGINLLFLNGDVNLHLSDSERELFKSFGCAWYGDISLSDVIYMRNHDNIECRSIVADSVSRAKVSAIVYEYETLAFNECQSLSSEALNVINPNAIDFEKSHFFDVRQTFGALESNEQFTAGNIAFLYDQISKDKYSDRIPKLFSDTDSITAPIGLASWVKQNIFGCGNNLEDQYGKGIGENEQKKWVYLSRKYFSRFATDFERNQTDFKTVRGLAHLPLLEFGFVGSQRIKNGFISNLELEPAWQSLNSFPDSFYFGSSDISTFLFPFLENFLTIPDKALRAHSENLSIAVVEIARAVETLKLNFSVDDSIRLRDKSVKKLLNAGLDTQTSQKLANYFVFLGGYTPIPLLAEGVTLQNMSKEQYLYGIRQTLNFIEKCGPIHSSATRQELENSPCGVIGE